MRAVQRIFLLALALFATPLAAADRIALVIGNGHYEHVTPLDNTINDAEAIADTLTAIGFDVTRITDARQADFATALNDFAFRVETADLALIYYAGHGVEVQGKNFLIPVDANVGSNRDIQRQSISLQDLLAVVDHARKMRIVILDSCREEPFGDLLAPATASNDPSATPVIARGTGGLAAPSPDRGTLVAYAARDGQVALDGSGGNSPFAKALKEKLATPGLEISLMFRQVRDQVLAETNNLQEPNTYGALPGLPFYLAGPPEDRAAIAGPDRRATWSRLRPDQEKQLQALADKGDTRAMVGLAYMRLNPDNSRYDPAAAAGLLESAAAAGYPDAQFELAKLYEQGLGVAQDPRRALTLYQTAADQNFPDALNDLGFFHYYGSLGLPVDKVRALDYFRRAADQRHPEALFNYAALIDDGLVPGSGPEVAGKYLYDALRAGSDQVLDTLTNRPGMFEHATLKALQTSLKSNGLYSGGIDGRLGPATRNSIRLAFGLLPDEGQP